LQNGISLGIRKKHIKFGNKFDWVEGVRPLQIEKEFQNPRLNSQLMLPFHQFADNHGVGF